MEMVNDDEELEEDAQAEVDKVLWDLTAGQYPETFILHIRVVVLVLYID